MAGKIKSANNFEPKIITFCCNYCSYVAADTAGTRKEHYPHNVELVRLPCSGKVDVLYILEAFDKGADGVLVTGCRKEQCHFMEGNYKAEAKVLFLKDILDEIGFGGERLHIQFMSAGEPDEFVRAVRDMTTRIKELGPNPKK
jgi:coenzyme F420-reducing hydrogenase delta subunit